MLVVETIARIRREYFVNEKSIKEIVRTVKVSRNTVRKVVRSGATAFNYDRSSQPRPKIDPWRSELDEMLAGNARRAKRERLTLVRIYEELRNQGYDGGYDAVRRHAADGSTARQFASADAYAPLSFDPGEAYRFDWSHEIVVIDGVATTVKAAHVRLCSSRMPFVRAYPRETQEMVFDAHDKAFAFFGGACARGIYDNMKTAVDTIFAGKNRAYNRRFLQMCGHYLVDPVACTPASGWEKGQVENQVGVIRRRFFAPRPKFKSYGELNAWLEDRCVAYAQANRHPEMRDKTIADVFEEERASLIPYVGPFDGFHAVPASVSKTCLARFDKNRCSVDARAARRDPGLRGPLGMLAGRPHRRQPRPRLRARQDPLRSFALYPCPGPQTRRLAERRAVQGLGIAPGSWPCPAQAGRKARRRSADGGDPGRDPERRLGGRGGRLRRGARRQRPLRQRGSQHPGPPPRTAAGPDNRNPGRAAAGLRAGGRLQPI